MWFSCTETYWWSVHTSSSFVIDWCWHFFCGKYSRISVVFLIINWCWLFFMCKMFYHFWLMFMWFSCTETYWWSVHILHLSITEISILFLIINWCWLFFMCKMFLHVHFWLMFMWFSCTDTYWWSVHTSSSFVIYFWLLTDVDSSVFIINWCWLFFMCKMFLSFSTDVYVIFLYWHILMKCTHFIFICDWLMLTFFCGKYSRISIVFLIIKWCWLFFCPNVLIILNWCLCDFLVLKHVTEVYALHLHLSFTDVDIFLCCKCSRISIMFLTIYWCWLFFMCKMFSSFSTDVYVIFLYWNILMKCTHFIFICHWLMLTFLFVENILEFQ